MTIFEIFAQVVNTLLQYGGVGAFMLVCFIGLMILLLCFVGSIAFEALDRINREVMSAQGTVVEKVFTRGYYTTILVGKVPVPRYIPDRWDLTIIVEDKLGSIEVTQDYWDAIKLHSKVEVAYYLGRFSKHPYLVGIG